MPLRQTRPGSYERTNCGRIRLVPGHTRAAKYYYGLNAALLMRSIMYFTVKAMTSRRCDPTLASLAEILNHFSFAHLDSSGRLPLTSSTFYKSTRVSEPQSRLRAPSAQRLRSVTQVLKAYRQRCHVALSWSPLQAIHRQKPSPRQLNPAAA